MAKKLDSPCLFCGGLPCECDTGQTKKRSKRSVQAAPKKPSSPISSSVESDNDTEDVFGEIPTPGKPKFKFKSHSEERDLSLESALRVLRPIVRPSDQRKIDILLTRHYPLDIGRRLAEWKKRDRS